MHGAPLVTVICTVKDGARTIADVIESVLGQSMKEWEMVIVDDGSSDGTEHILRKYAEKDQRIQLVETPGIGRGRALNLALAHSRGSFIANIDADDPSHPCRLELQSKALLEHEHFALLASETKLLHGMENPVWPTIKAAPVPVADVTRRLLVRNPINHSSVMVRRRALERVGGYAEARNSQLDYDLWVRLAAAGYRLGVVGLPLASKRLHEGQSFETRKRLRYLWESARVQAKAIQELNGGVANWMGLGLRFVWGLLPRYVRVSFSRTVRR